MKSITDRISKDQFDLACNNHQPNNWIKFAFRYFSKDTEKKDMAISNTVTYIFLGLFAFGFIGTILNLSKTFIGIFTILYSISLVILVSYLFSAAFLNKARIKKIRKELDITKEEYNVLIFSYS